MNEKAWLKMALEELFKTPIWGTRVNCAATTPGAGSRGLWELTTDWSFRQKGGPYELVIDAKGRYPAVIKPWAI